MAETDDALAKLLSSTVLVLVGMVVSSSAKLLERILLGRLLPPNAYGEFSIGLAIFTLGTTVGAAGYTQGIPRFMARFEDPRDVRGAWLTGLVFTVGISLAIAVALVAGAPFIVSRLFESQTSTVLFGLFAISIPLYVCFEVGVSAIRGQENTTYKILTQNLCYPGLRLLLIIGFLSLGTGVVASALGYVAALLVTIPVTYLLLSRLFPIRGDFRFHGREMTAFSAPLVVSSIMATLLTRTDTLMLGYFRPSSEVAVYNTAYPLAGVLTIVLGAIGYMYLPVASRLDGSDEDGVERIYEVTTKWIYLLVFPLFLSMLLYPSVIISTAFGPEYVAGSSALSVLAVGFFTNAAVGRNRETLSALGETSLILVSNVVAFALNLALNLLLIPLYGFMGAAVASAASYLALNAVVYLFLWRRFDITPFNRRSARAFVAIPVLLIPLGYAFRRSTSESLTALLAFVVVFSSLTVAVALAVRSLQAEDLVVIEFIESRTSVKIPLVRDYIPEA